MAGKNKQTDPEKPQAVLAESIQWLLEQAAIQSPRDKAKAKDLAARLTAATAAEE